MLGQIITTLLSVLLGGLLTIIGGIITNHYVQSMSNKNEKRKQVKKLVEKVYRNVQSINQLHDAYYAEDDIDRDPESTYRESKRIGEEIDNAIQELELLIDLYLRPLKKDFVTYKKSIRSLEKIGAASQEFYFSISKFYQDKGYSYF